jgi:hypothetical protein
VKRGVLFAVVAAFFMPHWVSAQMQPHRAQYVLRLGAAANAPRIGTAVQNIILDCTGWHIKRDVLSEVPLTSSLKVSLASKLDGDESRDGHAFRYHTVQVQNGIERDVRGKVQRTDGETHAEISSPGRLKHLILPPLTLMPVAAVGHLIKGLLAGTLSVPTPVFGAEGTGGAFLVDVKELDPGSLRPIPPALKPVNVPAKKFWSIAMTVAPAIEHDQKPLFSMRAQIFDSGVLDRLTIDAGIVSVTADLEALEMHELPDCSGL